MQDDDNRANKRRSAALVSNARRAKRQLGKLLAVAARDSAVVTDWESGFLESVTGRLETYGKAFVDPEKGHADMALSFNQGMKLRQIQALVKRRGSGGTKRKDGC